MLRDDGSDGGGRRRSPRNVLGEPLDICSMKPMTGFYRDGCCNTGREDVGSHTVCAVMTSAFLNFPNRAATIFRHRYRNLAFRALNRMTVGVYVRLAAGSFPGRPSAPCGPRATHEGALAYCSLADLKRFAVDLA